tara:strand:- start:1958 stop:3394 length:1437 start_codon:yes stop_codon:yes gene_type:complete
MKVAIVHYHLEPGGVTRVIENTLQAWKDAGIEIEAVVLSGRQYKGSGISNAYLVQGLDYTTPENAVRAETLSKEMEDVAQMALGSVPDIWHIHNHSLGKNPALPLALAKLAQKGARMLLHPHDFAEDGRPGNYKALSESYQFLYPSTSGIHYAALNHRDLSYLQKMLEDSPSKAHLLANAIPDYDENLVHRKVPSLPENLFLYPVRAVRRKNLGELALLSLVHPEKYFANSLGPTNPNFQREFNQWKQFTSELNLNLTYGLGEKSTASFLDMVAHAEAIVSTSIAEGFGLGFLEPWTFGKGLCGRNIPEITKDFENLGINLQNLYSRCEVSLDFLDKPKKLRTSIQKNLEGFYQSYEVVLPKNGVDQAYHSIVQNGKVDFGRLDECLQKQILTKLSGSKIEADRIREQIPLNLPTGDVVERNQRAVKLQFSQIEYGKKLYSIYNEVLSAKDAQLTFAHGRKLLDAFLSPKRLNLLRTS